MNELIGTVYKPVNYREQCPWCNGPVKPTGEHDKKWAQYQCKKPKCNGKNKWWA